VPTTDSQFGGNFDNDNSGVLRYVRGEFAGIALEPNKEINGITFGSVGSGTVVDYVQVTLSGDDSFEWFGGTVNCKHLIAYRGLDDDFDCDFGFRGKVQFALSIRDKDLYDAPGDSNAFECDNDAAGSTAQPKTRPVFSNVTLVGAKGNGTTALPSGEKFEKAFRLRRNSAVSVLNSLVTGWEKGLSIEGAPVVANLNGDTMVFVNNILTNFAQPTWSANNTNTVLNSGGSTTAWYNSWWGVEGNDSTASLAQVNWVNLFTALGVTPDARLAAGSIAASGATFMSIAGTRRLMRKNAFMLVHELRNGNWGKYTELKEDMTNNTTIMKAIKEWYKENTKMPEKEIDTILSKDIWWNAKTCLKYGLIDKFI
jgi:hypothetical protein